MKQSLGAVSLLVKNYDEAIDWFTRALGFELTADIPQGNKRWVTVKPKGAAQTELVLAQPSNPEQAEYIGKQGAGRVWLFLNSDDFYRDHRAMIAEGVHFLEEPREEVYGIVAVFEDLYGNKWDLIQRLAQ